MSDGQRLLASLLAQVARLSGAQAAALSSFEVPGQQLKVRAIHGQSQQLVSVANSVALDELGPDISVVRLDETHALLVHGADDPRVVDSFVEPLQAALQLEVASRRTPRLVSSLGHELRTPLNAILGYTEMLLDGVYGEVPETLHDAIRRIHQSGRILLDLTSDIVDLCAFEAGRVELSRERYSVAGVVDTIVEQMQPEATARGVQLKTDISPDLPIGWGDERRITQALLNVVGNAITFSEARTVTLATFTSDDMLVVRVSDDGAPLSSAELDTGAGETSPRLKGEAGLRLSLAKWLVEAHGGRMSLESGCAEGATFSLWLPVHA